jgi:hypothetical protein
MSDADIFILARSLPFTDAVVLSTMRCWAAGLTDTTAVEDQIDRMFVKLGAPDATGQLFSFMLILRHSACRSLAIGCVYKAEISADESCLLDVLALSQHRRTFEALLLLRSLVRPRSATAAQDSAGRVGACLAAAGRMLTPRQSETTRHVLVSDHWSHRGLSASPMVH